MKSEAGKLRIGNDKSATVPASATAAPSSAPTNRRAVIDIGTNSVKLLVAEVGVDVEPLFEDSKQTRLGQGFYETHLLKPDSITKTAEAVAKFADIAHEWGAQSIRAIATSAARDANNPGDLTEAVAHTSGLQVEIITGEQEADWAFQGVTSDPALAQHPLLLLDVGGGSTEFILGHGEHKDFSHSFALGSVRLLEKFPVSDPPAPAELATVRAWVTRFLRQEVRPKLLAELKHEAAFDLVGREIQLVGTGGTATILARIQGGMEDFDRSRIESMRLSALEVGDYCQHLWNLPLAARQQIIGLPRKRADVILSGTVIYEAVMKEFGFTELRVSTRGLRYAVVKGAI